MNAKQRYQNRRNAAHLQRKVVPPPTCANCGQPGSHFAAPCFGQRGFFMCDSVEQREAGWIAEADAEARGA